jgi:hypothetical protein
MEQSCGLRELANSYRNWAELGNNADRGWREGFAEYLDQRANDIEQLSNCAEKRVRDGSAVPDHSKHGDGEGHGDHHRPGERGVPGHRQAL